MEEAEARRAAMAKEAELLTRDKASLREQLDFQLQCNTPLRQELESLRASTRAALQESRTMLLAEQSKSAQLQHALDSAPPRGLLEAKQREFDRLTKEMNRLRKELELTKQHLVETTKQRTDLATRVRQLTQNAKDLQGQLLISQQEVTRLFAKTNTSISSATPSAPHSSAHNPLYTSTLYDQDYQDGNVGDKRDKVVESEGDLRAGAKISAQWTREETNTKLDMKEENLLQVNEPISLSRISAFWRAKESRKRTLSMREWPENLEDVTIFGSAITIREALDHLCIPLASPIKAMDGPSSSSSSSLPTSYAAKRSLDKLYSAMETCASDRRENIEINKSQQQSTDILVDLSRRNTRDIEEERTKGDDQRGCTAESQKHTVKRFAKDVALSDAAKKSNWEAMAKEAQIDAADYTDMTSARKNMSGMKQNIENDIEDDSDMFELSTALPLEQMNVSEVKGVPLPYLRPAVSLPSTNPPFPSVTSCEFVHAAGSSSELSRVSSSQASLSVPLLAKAESRDLQHYESSSILLQEQKSTQVQSNSISVASDQIGASVLNMPNFLSSPTLPLANANSPSVLMLPTGSLTTANHPLTCPVVTTRNYSTSPALTSNASRSGTSDSSSAINAIAVTTLIPSSASSSTTSRYKPPSCHTRSQQKVSIVSLHNTPEAGSSLANPTVSNSGDSLNISGSDVNIVATSSYACSLAAAKSDSLSSLSSSCSLVAPVHDSTVSSSAYGLSKLSLPSRPLHVPQTLSTPPSLFSQSSDLPFSSHSLAMLLPTVDAYASVPAEETGLARSSSQAALKSNEEFLSDEGNNNGADRKEKNVSGQEWTIAPPSSQPRVVPTSSLPRPQSSLPLNAHPPSLNIGAHSSRPSAQHLTSTSSVILPDHVTFPLHIGMVLVGKISQNHTCLHGARSWVRRCPMVVDALFIKPTLCLYSGS